ncbi:FxSxx-COOH system tetratricopeptide repeat protein [Pseudonocardia alaniniphila]|uniref:FxSxx-COOH system tetratricopeptide repeat protein n=1 Tax=Pseudonocardia alaniniphila TaxID=75291 RepID=A0ABS9TUW1_9PSEU|nr:FxSxx-COOH system tetratricopeptide repeat protein [Pseudonocardia alaniniphila]MCH6172353.1 FxSxx-COOH system tetratricopeptide repeat protein [Pseudonocardia alaniniphila]
MGPAAERGHDLRWAQGVQIGNHNIQTNIFSSAVTFTASLPVGWPVRVGAVPALADCYQDRVEASSLFQVVAAGDSPTTHVLSGLGGVGKTQLAAAHARARSDVDLLVWTLATSRDAILSGYAQAAAQLGHQPAGDTEAAAQWFLTWLQAEAERSWLIVLDDLAEPTDLQGLWPDGPRGLTVVTTRRSDAVLMGSGRQRVDVGLFTSGQSRTYLSAKLGTDPPGERMREADELATELGHLPLALAQAAAFMLDRGDTCARYRTRLADRRRRLAELFPSDALADDYRATVAATWSISIDAADALQPPGLARPVLELLSILDPNGVPTAILRTDVAVAYATHRSATSPREPQDLTDALHHLARLSLVTLDPGGAAAGVRVHGLVQRAVIEQLDPEQLDVLHEIATGALLTIWPDVERDAQLGQVLRSNVTTLMARAGLNVWHSLAQTLRWRTGLSLQAWGLVRPAIRHWEQVASDACQHLGPDHPYTLAARGNAAACRLEAGDPRGASEALEKLLDDYSRVLGPDHSNTLTTRSHLADCRGHVGDLAGAVGAFEQLLDDCSRVLGPDDPGTLVARGNLAYWTGEAGNPLGAIEVFEPLLADCLRVLGPDHPHTHTARVNLARCYSQTGNVARSAAMEEQALADLLRDLGPDNPETFLLRHNIAWSRGQAGDRVAAADAFQQLLADCLRMLGPDHPFTFQVRQSVANLRGDAGDPAGAVVAMAELVEDRVRVQGADHVDTLVCRYRHARLRADGRDLAGAETALTELLADLERVLGGEHPHTLGIRGDLAGVHGDAGDPAAAVAELHHLLADTERALGSDHPETLRTRFNLARWLADSGDRAGAAEAFQQLLSDYVRVLGPDHSATLSIRVNLAKLRGTAGDPAYAVDAFEQLLAARVRLLGPDHHETLATRLLLAGFRGKAGDHAGAARAFEELAADMIRVLGTDNPDTLFAGQGAIYWRHGASRP